jgi:hypothetical protein
VYAFHSSTRRWPNEVPVPASPCAGRRPGIFAEFALERYYAKEWLSVSPAGADLVSGRGFSATRSGALHYDVIEIAEPITRVHGRAAVSTSRITVKGRNKGQDISGVYRVSTMLAKENGTWKIVALVSSPLEATHAPD